VANDQFRTTRNGLLQDYLSLGDNTAIIVRQLKKTAHADIRNKLVGELRNIDMKRIDILNRIDTPSD
jgi:hypothetical protein